MTTSTATASSSASSTSSQEVGRFLYKILNRIFEHDPNIDEMGIILSEKEFELVKEQHHDVNYYASQIIEPSEKEEQQQAPSSSFSLPFLLKEHKLGIGMLNLKPLYQHSKKKFSKHVKQQESQQQQHEKHLLHSSRAILMIHADNYTCWNWRKAYLQSHSFEEAKILQEIQFLNMIMSKHPKSLESWSHRHWCISNWIHHSTSTAATSSLPTFQETVIKQEFKSCERAATLYPRNYYAWNYRIQLNQLLLKHQLLTVDLVLSEMESNQQYLKKNIGDNSSNNYAVQLFHWLKQLRYDGFMSMILQHLYRNQFNILFFPGHEALWYYRRQLYYLLIQYMSSFQQPSTSSAKATTATAAKATAAVDSLLISAAHEQLEVFNKSMGRSTSSTESEADAEAEEEKIELVLLQQELEFCLRCSTDDAVSNFDRQRKFSLSFQVYLLRLLKQQFASAASWTTEQTGLFVQYIIGRSSKNIKLDWKGLENNLQLMMKQCLQSLQMNKEDYQAPLFEALATTFV